MSGDHPPPFFLLVFRPHCDVLGKKMIAIFDYHKNDKRYEQNAIRIEKEVSFNCCSQLKGETVDTDLSVYVQYRLWVAHNRNAYT